MIFNIISSLHFFKLLQVLLVSGIKFLFAPLLAIGYGFNYLQTVGFTTAGGILGILFFYFLSKWLIRQYEKFCPRIVGYFGGSEATERWLEENKCRKSNRKVFTRKNKLIINIRNKYGLIGIILLTPVLLSIPIGAFLAQKYYARKTNILVYMSISVVLWSCFLSGFFFLL
jgi:hypothetical protein